MNIEFIKSEEHGINKVNEYVTYLFFYKVNRFELQYHYYNIKIQYITYSCIKNTLSKKSK